MPKEKGDLAIPLATITVGARSDDGFSLEVQPSKAREMV